MTGREASDRWNAGRRRLRELISQHTPEVLTFYPWEVFVSLLGLLIGIPLLLGLAAPTSLALLLPSVIYWVYATALVLGGATVALGLRIKRSQMLASGLQLLGGSYVVYAIAVVVAAGWASAFLAFSAFGLVGLLCMVRSHHFRRLVDIQRGASRLGSP